CVDRAVQGRQALLATGSDQPVPVQRGHDPQGIPGAVRKVFAAVDVHAMLGGNARKRGRHQDLLPIRGEDQEPPLEEPLKRGNGILRFYAQGRGETGSSWRFASGDEVLIDRMPDLQVRIDYRSASLGCKAARLTTCDSAARPC